MRMYARNTFASAALFFIIFAVSFHLYFGATNRHKIAFDHYPKKNLLHNLKFVVALNPFFSIPFNIISIIEIFEKVPSFDKYLKNHENQISSFKVSAMRIFLLTMLWLMTLMSTNIALILDLVGSVFGPILGLFLPVSNLIF
jgi:Transmembrane amino acid transporter protein